MADTQLVQDDEERRRLLAIVEACRAKEAAAAAEISRPRHSMLYSSYMKLTARLGDLRLECHEKLFAYRAYRKKIREEAK
jgi:hypothetical protein